MCIDIKTRRPRLANITGGLSGPAVKPVAVRMVWQCYNAVSIPIIGMGGILSADDAIEFILAGASGVAVGTGNFINPGTTMDVLQGIQSYMSDRNIKSINELVGAVNC
jgi:dihydroorotate dehydrogenase (NAD+) catalytic subunit